MLRTGLAALTSFASLLVAAPRLCSAQPASQPASEPASGPNVEIGVPVLRVQPSLPEVKSRALLGAVRVEGPHHDEMGLLVGDRRTVLVGGYGIQTGRRYKVTPLGTTASGGGSRTSSQMQRAGDGSEDLALWIHLDDDSAGEPLEISSLEPRLDAVVFVLVRRPDKIDPLEVIQTRIVGVSEKGFSVAVPLPGGSFVLDGDGRLLAVGGRSFEPGGRKAVLVRRLKDTARPVPRVPVLPVFGLRAGYQEGGILGRGAIISIEGGVALWDRLGFVVRFGLGIGDGGVVALPVQKGLGPGIADTSNTTFDFGLEARYRQLLTSTAAIYFELAAGMQLVRGGRDVTGLAIFSSDPTCDPAARSCPLVVRSDADAGLFGTGVGPTFGADLRFSLLTLGYRFTPGRLSHNLPNLHTATIGVVGL